MKALFFAVALTATLITLPAVAQQGPAGVPGAPGLAPLPSPPVVVAAPPPTSDKPSTVKASPHCGKTGSGKPTKQCKQKKKPPASCSSAADPARCEQYRKTRELCKNLPERDYRQCLRDNLSATK